MMEGEKGRGFTVGEIRSVIIFDIRLRLRQN